MINFFKFSQVDGFIIVPSPNIKDTIDSLIKDNIPVVLLDRFFEGLDCNIVVVDNKQATFNATLHLVNNQFKNIGFITTVSKQTQMRDRLSGYEKAVEDNGLEANVLQIPYDEVFKGKAKEYIRDFLNYHNHLDAVFFATNYLAQNGLEVFKENDNRLINNLGIISFDDTDMFKIYDTSITSVSQPLFEICSNLMELMLSLLKKKDVTEISQKIILKTELIIRESSISK